MLVPGWGQIATSRDLLGRSLVFLTGLLGCAALTAYLFAGPMEIALWFTNPDVLLALVVSNVALALVRVVSTNLAWWDGGGRNWRLPVLLTLMVMVPHVVIGWVGIEARSSLLTIFAAPPAMSAPTTTSTSSTTTTTLSLSPIVTLPGQHGEELGNIAKAEPWRPFGESRLNVLILGGDAGPGRGGLRTDTIMVASVDPISGDAALFGIPRNYGGLEFTNGDPVPVRRLNHVYQWGVRHPDAYGGTDPGASAVSDAVEHISGLDIDHFVLVDLTGFANVIDVFGGVTVEVREPIDGPLYDTVTGQYEMVRIATGTRHLDGAHALAYARARYGSSDYARMARQRCILASLATQTNPLQILTNLGGVLDVIESNITTDMPVDMVPELLRLLLRVSGRDIRVMGFDSSWGKGVTFDGHTIPDIDRIRAAVAELIGNPTNVPNVSFASADSACN